MLFTKTNSCASVRRNKGGLCRVCAKERARQVYGHKPKNSQVAGKRHTFPCGCSGVLPLKGQSNLFCYRGMCRISKILWSNLKIAERCGYKPMDVNTPHTLIRKMMKKTNCERCGKPLKWILRRGKTPHLHHNHTTGEIYGFTHHHCNPRALEDEIERLQKQIKRLTARVLARRK